MLNKPEAHLRGPFKLVYTTVVIFYNLWEEGRKDRDKNPDSVLETEKKKRRK